MGEWQVSTLESCHSPAISWQLSLANYCPPMEGLSRQYRMLRYNKRMEAEVAVITAGAGGLGRLIIRRLAQRGFVAVVADSDREANLRLCQAAR